MLDRDDLPGLRFTRLEHLAEASPPDELKHLVGVAACGVGQGSESDTPYRRAKVFEVTEPPLTRRRKAPKEQFVRMCEQTVDVRGDRHGIPAVGKALPPCDEIKNGIFAIPVYQVIRQLAGKRLMERDAR